MNSFIDGEIGMGYEDALKEEEKNVMKNKLLDTYGVFEYSDRGDIKSINHVNLAKLIMMEHDYHFITIEDAETGKQEIYYYKNGMYYHGGENRIKSLVDFYLDNYTSIHRKNEVIDFIRNSNCVNRRNLEPPLNLINMANGIYDIDKDELIPHTPKYHFLNQIPVKYDKDAKCPNIMKFFKQVLYEKYIPVMQELFGYLLYRDYFLHKAFLFLGGGRNGKGTVIQLMSAFLGDGNYSTRKLHSLVEDKFAKASLYGKLANLGAEVSAKALVDTGDFKNLTGGEPITGERKFYGAFNFKNYAKLIFNANQMPYVKYDKSFAFFQRWIVFPFPETFAADDPNTDPFIIKKLTTEEELSGLFNWAIVGLKRLLKNCKFTKVDFEGEDNDEERFEMLAKTEKQFILERLDYLEGNHLPKDEVYGKYVNWANQRMYPRLTMTSFTRAIKKYIKGVDVSRVRIGKQRVMVYTNIAWKPEYDDGFQPHSPLTNFIPKDEKTAHVEKEYGLGDKEKDI